MTISTLSASSTLLASLTITSACNPDKLELVEVKIENINRMKEKIRTLLDTSPNISVFEPDGWTDRQTDKWTNCQNLVQYEIY